MDRIVPRIDRDKDFEQNIVVALKLLKPHCAWTEGEWDGLGMKWNEIQAVPRHMIIRTPSST